MTIVCEKQRDALYRHFVSLSLSPNLTTMLDIEYDFFSISLCEDATDLRLRFDGDSVQSVLSPPGP